MPKGETNPNKLRREKIDLGKYDGPIVQFDADRREWYFFYQLKPPGMPGGHFTWIVDEHGKVRHVGGA